MSDLKLEAKALDRPVADGGFRSAAPYLVAAFMLVTALVMMGEALARGWFGWPGYDYRAMAAAARSFLTEGPAAAYNMDSVSRAGHILLGDSGVAASTAVIGAAPYPPVFFLLVAPFALLSLPAGFLAWFALNLTLTIYVLRGLAGRFGSRRGVIVLTMVLSIPVLDGLLNGQPVGLLLIGLYESYRALEHRQELRAGLWLAPLILKPQYVLLIGLVFLIKRRWSAFGGLAAVGLVLALASIAIAGPDGTRAYLTMLREASTFRTTLAGIGPADMMNWRGLLVNLFPSLSDTPGFMLTTVLEVVTAGVVLLAWRGPWNPSDPRFAARMLVTLAGTLLASYHNHLHGAVLLLVPLLVMAAQGTLPRPARLISLLAVGAAPLVVIGMTELLGVNWRETVAMTFTLATALLLVVTLLWLHHEPVTTDEAASGA